MDDEINLLDYWRVLMKRKWLLILIIGTTAIASAVISFYLPVIYASTTSLLPPQGPLNGSALLASRLPSGLSGLQGLRSPVDLWLGILKSETIRDALVSQFNLREVYAVETDQIAGRSLGKALKVKKSREGIISITVEDKDPDRAAQLANAFAAELDKFNKNIVMTSGGRMRTFVEKRLDEAKEALTEAEEAVKTFQEKNGAFKLDTQSTAIIGAIGNIKGKVMAKEVELQTLLSFATPQNPRVEILKTELKGLKRGLRELEEGKPVGEESTKSLFIPTARFPELGLQYARLIREEKSQQTLFGLLMEQYEMSRIQEAKDTPTVQILDVAKVPELRVKPKRRQIVFLSIFTAFFFSIFLVFFLEYTNKARVQAVQREKIGKQ